ncbi:hypothetical protein GCM10023195_70910 [Actinoallomurus liliacearum]|uniref:Uncharacterized protein n=1 Tax=Actinoallomurus liliacearum TaxID=1080073 RepID=A0ABP8TVQ9_9ACTN
MSAAEDRYVKASEDLAKARALYGHNSPQEQDAYKAFQEALEDLPEGPAAPSLFLRRYGKREARS